MPGERFGQPPPIVQAMLLADYIHTDSTTGKRYILGTYDQLVAARFPHVVPRLWVFLALTGGHGSTLLRVRVVDVDEEIGTLAESTQPTNLVDPNSLYYFSFPLSVTFPVPGLYRVQSFADHELLRELRLEVRLRQPAAPPLPEG